MSTVLQGECSIKSLATLYYDIVKYGGKRSLYSCHPVYAKQQNDKVSSSSSSLPEPKSAVSIPTRVTVFLV